MCMMKKKYPELFWLHMFVIHVIKLWFVAFTIWILILGYKYYWMLGSLSEALTTALTLPLKLAATINGTELIGTIGH